MSPVARLLTDVGLRGTVEASRGCFLAAQGAATGGVAGGADGQGKGHEGKVSLATLMATQIALVNRTDHPARARIRLRRGLMMPMLGLGTGYGNCYHKAPHCSKGTLPPVSFYVNAFQKAGVRLVDTAALYGTERDLGEAYP